MRNSNISFLWSTLLLIIFCFTSGELFGMEIVANDGAEGDKFGYAVAISGDYAIVGAYENSENDIKSGAAYIFKRDGDLWVQMQKLVADDAENSDHFGFSVSISENYAIIGARNKSIQDTRTGAAYIYKRTDKSWSQMQKIFASDGQSGDQFGYSVSISGGYAIIGAPFSELKNNGNAYIFRCSEEKWTEITRRTGEIENDILGSAVSIKDNFAIMGSSNSNDNNHCNNCGCVLIYQLNDDSWNFHQKFSGNQNNDGFGRFVSNSDDYSLIIDKATAYILTYDGSYWSQSALHQADNIINFAYISGKYAIIGVNRIVYVFSNSNNENNWQRTSKFGKIDDSTSAFGVSVSISNETWIIGNPLNNGYQGGIAYVNAINEFKNCQLTGYILDIKKIL